MSAYNRLGLFGIPEGTLDEDEDKKISDISFTANDPFNINNQKGIVATDAFTGQFNDPNFGFIDENNPYGEGGA